MTASRPTIYPDLAVAVLAGGASKRFGADKALFRLESGGSTLLELSVAVALQLSDEVAVIGHERYANLEFDVPIVTDLQPGSGPLAGIVTALHRTNRPRTLIVACDMPCLSIPLLRWMIEHHSQADIVIPRTDDGQWQPMHAIYRASTLPVMVAALAAGQRSVRSLLSLVSVDPISESELRAIDPLLCSLIGINHLADVARAEVCVANTLFDTDRRKLPYFDVY